MNIQTLIDHYRMAKSAHSPIPESLDDKLRHLEKVFGNAPADASGSTLVTRGKVAWGHRSPGTLKRYLVQLRAVMRRAERDGLITRAPLIDLPYVFDTIYVDVSGAEVKLLLDYIKWTEPKWYPLALVLVQTGARLNEALTLEPASFTRHGVRIAKPINRRSKTIDRIIPYTQRMRAEVDAGVMFSGEGLRLVPDGIADQSVPTCFGRILDASVSALGLYKLRVHDLRHAFAAILAENGADLADIATALGQSNVAMALRYRGLVKGRLAGILSTV